MRFLHPHALENDYRLEECLPLRQQVVHEMANSPDMRRDSPRLLTKTFHVQTISILNDSSHLRRLHQKTFLHTCHTTVFGQWSAEHQHPATLEDDLPCRQSWVYVRNWLRLLRRKNVLLQFPMCTAGLLERATQAQCRELQTLQIVHRETH